MTASQNGAAPGIDARELRAARKRTFTAASKALANLEEIVAQDRVELGNGDVPPAAALRKQADKYLHLLAMLDLQDSLLTPEALEAIYAEHSEPGQVSVARQDLALFTTVVTQPQVLAVLNMPQEVPEDSPLGRLVAAVNALTPEMAAAVSVPGPQVPSSGG
jgi:hypothetical protein